MLAQQDSFCETRWKLQWVFSFCMYITILMKSNYQHLYEFHGSGKQGLCLIVWYDFQKYLSTTKELFIGTT